MRESAIALAAHSVSQGDYPAQSALFCDNKKKRVGISLFCEVFFSSWYTFQLREESDYPLVCFPYSQSQSSSKPFSLLLSTLNCDLWLQYPHRSGLVFLGDGPVPNRFNPFRWANKAKTEKGTDAWFLRLGCEYSSRRTSACLSWLGRACVGFTVANRGSERKAPHWHTNK